MATTNVSGLDHIVLVCTDVETTLAWYERHLGLEPVRVDDWRAGKVTFPSLRVDAGTIIDFIRGHDGQRGHLDHVCFVVTADDLAAAKESAELTVIDEGERYGARGEAHSIYVRDPDGLVVELRAYPEG